ncbi:MAG TPA: PPC domain-containing protein [Blastocatellia bacterium]|nr:PPC domain-containing protein [Blastocatellia bacterium]
MFTQSLRLAVAATCAALLLAATFVGAQDASSDPGINRNAGSKRQNNRVTPTAMLERSDAFRRIDPDGAPPLALKANRQRTLKADRAAALTTVRQAASAITMESFGTGGGDVFEAEPNDLVAQGISLPINVFGKISLNGDVDYFAFRALAGQQITVEAFAARLTSSVLVPEIALFDSSGQLLTRSVGDELVDPLLRYTPQADGLLIVGIADVDDLGDVRADYLLNITRGIDIEEQEPNNSVAQSLTEVPATIFGEVNGASDVDFYSFVGSAGQTLIVDVDAEVLGSRLDPEINLTDPGSGVEFFFNDQYDGDDSRFNIVLPHTGRYVIGIGSFESSSRGFYRLNASLVSSEGAPMITSVTRLAKKSAEVVGTGFSEGTVIEVNSRRVKTSIITSGTLRAKAKVKVGHVVTVANPPDDRRSNPLIVP